jgi:hypothetical protein
MTQSAPLDRRSSMASRNRFVVSGLKIPRHSSSKIAAFSLSRTGSSGTESWSPRFSSARA